MASFAATVMVMGILLFVRMPRLETFFMPTLPQTTPATPAPPAPVPAGSGAFVLPLLHPDLARRLPQNA
jgi:hypothetical protein